MNKLFENISTALAALEQENQDEFDAVAIAFSIFQDAASLLSRMYEAPRLAQWKQADNPAFDRFASKLKNALEFQRDYLYSVSHLFEPDTDAISQKIAGCQREINALLEKQAAVCKDGERLFEKEKELKAAKDHLDQLLQRKKELEEAEKQLSAYDPERLNAEINSLEKKISELEARYHPLVEKKEKLEPKYEELARAVRNLEQGIKQLEAAYGEESLKLAREIPEWTAVIRQKTASREEKDKKYILELAEEAETYKAAETRVQEHLRQMTQFAESAAALQDVFHAHFEADRQLGGRFSKSLSREKETLSRTAESIETELREFDEMLKELHREIEKVAGVAERLSI